MWQRSRVDVGLILGIVLGLVGLWVVLVIVLWLVRPRGVSARELLRLVPDLVRLLRSLLADRSTPPDVRIALVGLSAWILSPIDLIPEFIPVLGPLDDAIVAVLALRYVRRRMGAGELRARWPGTSEGFETVLRVIGRE